VAFKNQLRQGVFRAPDTIYLEHLTPKIRLSTRAFAIERSRGVILSICRFSLHNSGRFSRIARLTAGAASKRSAKLGGEQTCEYQEFMMSARNGDQSRFNRERKQKVAWWKRTHKLVEPRSKGTQPGGQLSPRAATVGVGMTTTMTPASLLPEPIPGGIKKKRVLLVDTSQAKRELRAEVMRKRGIDVDCVADIAEARSWWRAALYDLVLIKMEKRQGHRDKFCDDIRSATSPQRLAFLVGQPEYLANSPTADEEMPVQEVDQRGGRLGRRPFRRSWRFHPTLGNPGGFDANLRRPLRVSSRGPRRCAPCPAPPRDSEGRKSKRNTTPINPDDLLREELR
jgi:CheY-like chemotaxis protein